MTGMPNIGQPAAASRPAPLNLHRQAMLHALLKKGPAMAAPAMAPKGPTMAPRPMGKVGC